MSLKDSKRRSGSVISRPHFLQRQIGHAHAARSVFTSEPSGLSPRSPRYRSLDLWRGAACLLVVIFHSLFYASAANSQAAPELRSSWIALTDRFWIGVPMFFVISGYCISATADSHRRENRGKGDYFARRVRRIAPPYWCALALTLATVWIADGALRMGLFVDATAAFPAPWSLNAWQWFGNATLSESWRYLFIGGHPSYFLGHAWTLFYEEQFYVVTGLILALAPRRFFSAAALVTIVALAVRHTALRANFPVQGSFLDGHWLMFAAGILVYYYVNYASFRGRRVCEAVLIAAVIYAARDFNQVRGVPNTIDANALIAFVFAALLGGLHRWDAALSAMSWTRPFHFCGTMCYSLYLVHWPICKAISHGADSVGIRGVQATLLIVIPVCIAASLAAGCVFHVHIERRFLNVSRHAVQSLRSTESRSPTLSAAETSVAR